MSGSLSMLSPSRLSGSIRSSSSSGKTPSESKHSGTADNTLLMSLDRLGLESSERKTNSRVRKKSSRIVIAFFLIKAIYVTVSE